jgi:signal transduction histidine kinase
MKRAEISSQLRTTPISRLFLWVASLLYLGVLATDLYSSVIASTAPWRIAAFVGLMFALLALEQWAQRLPTAYTIRYLAVAFLLARMGLIELASAVDSSGIARVLYPLVPFAAYFSLGRNVSYGLAGFYLCAFVVKLSLFVPSWYVSKEAVSELLMFFIGLVFALSMAGVASEAEANRRRAEQLLGDLAVSHQKLKVYAEQAAELATAQERNRLARDIHDGLGHYLVAINVLLEKIIAFRQRDPQEAEMAALDARRLTREALQDVRQSVGALRFSGEVFSLAAALSDLVKNAEQERFTVSLQISGDETGFSKTVLQALYRTAQEALTNVQKHARASKVSLCVLLHAHEASLFISDDGEGFDTSLLDRLPADRSNRFGLQGIRERLEVLGGILEVESCPNQGTRLAVSVPRMLPDHVASALQYPQTGRCLDRDIATLHRGV